MKEIDLALSGGGIRAMVFHLGVLRFLAEQQKMEHIRRISCVSGGSLITGLIVKEAGMRWPDSSTFLQTIYPALQHKLCNRSLITDMLRQLIRPENYRYLLSRANILGKALEKEWGITEKLADLPRVPEISFEGTTAENGKRFRFKRDSMGDYDIGYAEAGHFPLSQALAVSAAFPGGIGPLQLDTRLYQWQHPVGSESSNRTCPYDSLHLYDGGVYDNLGLEPFFDATSGKPKRKDGFLLVSDAGSPFRAGFSYGIINPLRLKRVLDITMEQCRSLRIRSLVGYLTQKKGPGAYLWINTTLSENEALHAFASAFPTTLRKLTASEFNKLAQYGYLVARLRLRYILDEAAAQTSQTKVGNDVKNYYHIENE
ncbi:TPA: patatin-like phospholipase family protein [Citrobacter freundii]